MCRIWICYSIFLETILCYSNILKDVLIKDTSEPIYIFSYPYTPCSPWNSDTSCHLSPALVNIELNDIPICICQCSLRGLQNPEKKHRIKDNKCSLQVPGHKTWTTPPCDKKKTQKKSKHFDISENDSSIFYKLQSKHPSKSLHMHSTFFLFALVDVSMTFIPTSVVASLNQQFAFTQLPFKVRPSCHYCQLHCFLEKNLLEPVMDLHFSLT